MDYQEKRAACEHLLRQYGFQQCQVTLHGGMVRIQVPTQEFHRFHDTTLRERIVKSLKTLGFVFVGLDLESPTIPQSREVDSPLTQKE